MRIEIMYADGATYTAYISDEALNNAAACLLDDNSVVVVRTTGGDSE